MANKDIFAPNGLLETCQAWQEVVSLAPTLKEKDAAGKEACLALGRVAADFNVADKIIVRSNLALMLQEEPAEDKLWAGIQFEEIVARGILGRISYIRLNDQGTITWPLFEAQVLNTQEAVISTDDDLPPEDVHHLPTDRIRRPIYLPVNGIDLALYAA